jgi:hypothetical protein
MASETVDPVAIASLLIRRCDPAAAAAGSLKVVQV